MTNKVKPFYIKITEDMTPQMVQDAFDKCVDTGAGAYESIETTQRKHYYQDEYSIDFNYFGVAGNETYLADDSDDFGQQTQEITLDQLNEWLGIEIEREWNGEGLPPVGVECEFKKYYQNKLGFVKCFIVGETKDKEWLVIHDYADDELHFANKRTRSFEFRPIESPEQKAKRERLEAAYDLYSEFNSSCGYKAQMGYDGFIDSDLSNNWLTIVEKTNYRKQ